MAKLPIIILPDPVLRQPSAPLGDVDDSVRKLIDDMLETMYDAPGIGLAAVQVNVPKRLIVLDTAGEDEAPNPLAMINPEIVRLGDQTRVYEEGCLSLPEVRIDIERPTTLTVKYIDRNGRPQTLDADGLLATAIQHEVDHLEGKLIIDFLSRLKRDMVVRRFKKNAPGGGGTAL